jgi:hypothetical protein
MNSVVLSRTKIMKVTTLSRATTLLCMSMLVAACGGGSSSTNPPTTPPPSGGGSSNTLTWVAGQFPAEASLKNRCESPRSGTDPFSGEAYPDQAGSSFYEKMWLRSWSDNTYLWYNEIDDKNPQPFSVLDYFDELRTNFRTDSGSFKDNFHFSQSTAEYNALAQGGVDSGYGFSWEFVRTTAPRKLIVRYTQPGSPAGEAGISRGLELKTINGVDFVNTNSQTDVNFINEALFPEAAGQSFTFGFADSAGNSPQQFTLVSSDVTVVPVQNVAVMTTDSGPVGYMQFNTFIRSGQSGLIDAFQQFADANVKDLVVDLRYNGGGLLAMASQFAYMVAGSAQTNGLTFETTQFNAKHPTIDPVTGNTLRPTPFYEREIDWAAGVFTNRTLPSVNLSRVYVLTTDSTCSASEAFINGLQGIGVEVIQIGGTTCGKPYGFYPTDNCGTTYFTIQFQGVNEQGFGDYADGFRPTPAPIFAADIKGCEVEDDFAHVLGDPAESMLSTALTYMQSGSCPAVNSAKGLASKYSRSENAEGIAIRQSNDQLKAFILENKLITPLRD